MIINTKLIKILFLSSLFNFFLFTKNVYLLDSYFIRFKKCTVGQTKYRKMFIASYKLHYKSEECTLWIFSSYNIYYSFSMFFTNSVIGCNNYLLKIICEIAH